MSHDDGYWIDLTGEIKRIRESHVQELIAQPEKFGLTRTEIQDAYTKYYERLGWEGKGREELLRTVIARGFVRIRKRGNQGYSITVHRLTEEAMALIRKWTVKVLNGEIGEEEDRFASVTVVPLVGGQPLRTTLEEAGKRLDDPVFSLRAQAYQGHPH